MATRRRKRRTSPGSGLSSALVWVALIAGVAAGGWWWYTNRPAAGPVPEPEAPRTQTAPAKPAAREESPERFEFYDMLPDAEVDVPENDGSAPPARSAPITVPGAYVLQAGAFPDFAEADKVKARLALLGIVSAIQKAETANGTFHRVRIGPIENLEELNRLRARLRGNQIEHLVIPVGE